MPYKDYNSSMNEYMKNRWLKRRNKAVEYLGGVCVVCNTTENLEFDHIKPESKCKSIARMSSYSEEKFMIEVDKCQLLCDTHHKEKHKNR